MSTKLSKSTGGILTAILKVIYMLFVLAFRLVKWLILLALGIIFIWPHRFAVAHGGDSRGIILYLMYLLVLVGAVVYFFLWDNIVALV